MNLRVIFFLFVFFLFYSCSVIERDDSYFNGKIEIIKDISTEFDLEPTQIFLDGANYGSISVYDSLIFFCNTNSNDSFYEIYNVNNGNLIGNYVPRGGGPSEINDVIPIHQFYKENGDLKTLLYALNEKKLLLWNVSKSIDCVTTVYDSIITYDWTKEHTLPYIDLTYLNEKEIITFIHPANTTLSGQTATLPRYQKRTLYTNELLDTYCFFKDSIQGIEAVRYFASSGYVKPDQTKLAQGMSYLSQLNILNFETGEKTGYRMAGTPDFSVFRTISKSVYDELPLYYTVVRANDDYIYAMYAEGKISKECSPHIIHVYSWDGELLGKLNLKGEAVRDMFLDPVNNKLYTSNTLLSDDVYCYDLNDLTFNPDK